VSALRALATRVAAPARRLTLGERLIRRNPFFYSGAAAVFGHLAAAPLEERRAWTHEHVGRILRAASGTGYGGGRPPRLEAWPLLGRHEVRGRPKDFVRRTAWTVPSSTGGTTGVPLPLWRSLQSVAAEQAALDHVLRACGVDPARARVAVLRADDLKALDDREPPFWRSSHGGRHLVFSSNHLDHRTVGAFAQALETFGADYWWVYPTTLESLRQGCERAGLELRVPLIFASSEVLGETCRARAAEQFGARVVDYYGQAERVAFAYSLEPGIWRFLPGYAHVELLPAEPDDDGPRYEIAGTGLWNGAMPLVRYRTGDLLRGDPGWDAVALEEVALGLRPFGGVFGRDGEFLVAPDGRWLMGLNHIARGVDRVLRIQLAHEAPDRVEIRVLPDRGYGEAQRALLLAHARGKIPSSIAVEVREVEALERTALGKTPFIVRRAGVPAPARGGDGGA